MFSISKTCSVVFVFITILLLVGLAQAQIVLDFEDGSLDSWEVVDEDAGNLGDVGPSTWEIRDSQLGLDGKALYQGSNIWGSPADSCLMGTFIIYKGEQFTNFTIDLDVAAADNDGMGLVWAYTGTDRHYRGIMINDRWPDVSVDGIEGPFMKIAKRISNEEPWYELLSVVKDDYVPYAEGQKLHWTLEVDNGSFTLTREDGLSISAEDHDYDSGYVGLQLYAQQAEFDNFTIVPHGATAVHPADKMASFWGKIKMGR
ncbi:MAG: hypothetical protein ACE5PV_20085 [Candidatus Poribacteria bacterium]